MDGKVGCECVHEGGAVVPTETVMENYVEFLFVDAVAVPAGAAAMFAGTNRPQWQTAWRQPLYFRD